MSYVTRKVWLLVTSIAAALMGQAAAADDVADFYSKNELRILVGNTSGGGYDTYARALARHLGRHIPGNPNIIVMNKPGAGGLAVANDLFNVSPRDGSIIAMPTRNALTEGLFGNEHARFDPLQFSWLGSMNSEVSLCGVWHTAPVTNATELRSRGMVVGGTSAGDDTVVFPRVLNSVAKTKLKIVSGYPGGNDINLAIERGEVEGRCGMSYSSLMSTRGDWMAQKKFRILLQLSTSRHPDLADIPTVMEIVDPAARDALQLIFARQYWGRPFMAPPGVPQERVAALRKAFVDTLKDPQFLSDAEKMKLEIEVVDGQAIQDKLNQLYRLPKQAIEEAKAAMQTAPK